MGPGRDQLRRIGGQGKITDKRMDVGWIEERHHAPATARERKRAENVAAEQRSRGTP